MNSLNTLRDELKTRCAERPAPVAAFAVVAAVLVWSYWGAINYLYTAWSNPDGSYGYCFLVPPFAAFLLWYRRDQILSLPPRGSWWGLVFLAVCGVLRWASVWFAMQVLEPLSLVPLLAGLIVLLVGWKGLRWAWPSLVILLFMYPLPGAIQGGFKYQLQSIATSLSAFLLQSFGIPVPNPGTGTVITLPSGPLKVEEACSGLRMLMLFQTACVGAAFVVRAPLWQKIIIMVSGTPIAVLSNVLRITLTGLIQYTFTLGPEDTGRAHDFAGWLMMPLALLFIWGEVVLMQRLFVTASSGGPPMLTRPLAGFAPGMPVAGRGRRRRST